jgi:hypothetical protein
MLRVVIIAYGLLYLIGAAVLLFLVGRIPGSEWPHPGRRCAHGAQTLPRAGKSGPGVLATYRRAIR